MGLNLNKQLERRGLKLAPLLAIMVLFLVIFYEPGLDWRTWISRAMAYQALLCLTAIVILAWGSERWAGWRRTLGIVGALTGTVHGLLVALHTYRFAVEALWKRAQPRAGLSAELIFIVFGLLAFLPGLRNAIFRKLLLLLLLATVTQHLLLTLPVLSTAGTLIWAGLVLVIFLGRQVHEFWQHPAVERMRRAMFVGLVVSLMAGSSLGAAPDRDARLEIRTGSAWGQLEPVVSAIDAFVVPLLGIDRRFGGHREPAAYTEVESEVRCPGMMLLGCEGQPVVFQMLYRNGNLTYLLDIDRRPRTRFYTQVITTNQAEFMSSGEYTQYSYHADRGRVGVRYNLSESKNLRLSPGIFLERRMTRYNLNQHTSYFSNPGNELAVFIGRFRSDDREWGLRPNLHMAFEILEASRLSIFFDLGYFRMRGVSNFGGGTVMLLAPSAVLTSLGAAQVSSMESGRSEYRSVGTVQSLGFSLGLDEGVSLVLEYSRRSEQRRFKNHARWSSDMTPEEVVVNAIALPALYSSRTFQESERFTRVMIGFAIGHEN